MIRRPAPAFITKLLEQEKTEFAAEKRIRSFDFIPLLKGLCEEYKIEFDKEMASYFRSLILRCGEVIYDLQCLDENLPPMSAQDSDLTMLQSKMRNQFALNLTLQERIKETETECLAIS